MPFLTFGSVPLTGNPYIMYLGTNQANVIQCITSPVFCVSHGDSAIQIGFPLNSGISYYVCDFHTNPNSPQFRPKGIDPTSAEHTSACTSFYFSNEIRKKFND